MSNILQSIKDTLSSAAVKVKDTAQEAGSRVSNVVEDVGSNFNDIGGKYHDQLVGGLAGMAVGGGLGAAATDTTDDKDNWSAIKHRLGNAAIGGLAGGAAGASAPRVYEALKPLPVPEKTTLEKTVDYINPAKNHHAAVIEGAGLGGLAGSSAGATAAAGMSKLTDEKGSVKDVIKEVKVKTPEQVAAAKGFSHSTSGDRFNPWSTMNKNLNKNFGVRAGYVQRRAAGGGALGVIAGALAGKYLGGESNPVAKPPLP